MAKTTTIQLEEPITATEGVLTAIELRDPRYAEYRRFGELWMVAYDEQGRGIPVESEATINAYIEACLVKPKSVEVLDQLCLADARKLRGWVTGFFSRGDAAKEGSTMSSQTSSSATAPSASSTPSI